MAKWLKASGLAVLLTISALGAGSPEAATSSGMEILSDDAARGSSEMIDVGAVAPIGGPSQSKPAPPLNKPAPRGNPLWAVPLSTLIATQERPIFSATRRPPPSAVAAMPAEAVKVPAPPQPSEAAPPLLLVGVVVGEGDAIAILQDRTDQKVIRMRQGELRGGWSLGSVQPREVTFRQGDHTEVLALPGAGALSAPPAVASAPAAGPANRYRPAGGMTGFRPESSVVNND